MTPRAGRSKRSPPNGGLGRSGLGGPPRSDRPQKRGRRRLFEIYSAQARRARRADRRARPQNADSACACRAWPARARWWRQMQRHQRRPPTRGGRPPGALCPAGPARCLGASPRHPRVPGRGRPDHLARKPVRHPGGLRPAGRSVGGGSGRGGRRARCWKKGFMMGRESEQVERRPHPAAHSFSTITYLATAASSSLHCPCHQSGGGRVEAAGGGIKGAETGVAAASACAVDRAKEQGVVARPAPLPPSDPGPGGSPIVSDSGRPRERRETANAFVYAFVFFSRHNLFFFFSGCAGGTVSKHASDDPGCHWRSPARLPGLCCRTLSCSPANQPPPRLAARRGSRPSGAFPSRPGLYPARPVDPPAGDLVLPRRRGLPPWRAKRCE